MHLSHMEIEVEFLSKLTATGTNKYGEVRLLHDFVHGALYFPGTVDGEDLPSDGSLNQHSTP